MHKPDDFPDIICSNDLTYRSKFVEVAPADRAYFLVDRGYFDKTVDPLSIIGKLERMAQSNTATPKVSRRGGQVL